MANLSPDIIRQIARDHYGLDVSVTTLPGEIDLNYFLEAVTGEKLILKIANPAEKREHLELQHALMNHLSDQACGLQTSKLRKTLSGEELLRLDLDGSGERFVRLLTWIEGRVFAKVNPHSPLLLQRLGAMCGTLCRQLKDFDHPAAHRFIKWDPSQAAWIKPHLSRFSGDREKIVGYFYALFEEEAVPLFPHLRRSVNYNDANDYNVLVSCDVEDPTVPGVIDFGDAVFTHTINELAIAIAYAVMDKADPLEAACHIVKGFNQAYRITEAELGALFPLVATRLLVSVVCSELNRLEHPENEYLQISDRPAWDLLARFKEIHPAFAAASFRHACGLAPSPKAERFRTWAMQNREKILPPLHYRSYSWLDLSIGSLDLGNTAILSDPDRLDEQITTMVNRQAADVALGRYGEARPIYTTTAFETATNDGPAWRTLHIGLDFFAKPGTAVRAVCDGTVYGLADNQAAGDYGPTVILQHTVSAELRFYTLYGHLQSGCLKQLEIGQEIKAGTVIAQVGARTENGNWTPHLHLQVILDMLGQRENFPGVCRPQDAPVWTSLCPDPWDLLTGEACPVSKVMPNDEIVAYRSAHLGKNLSISYRQPLQMVRGAGQYLVDHTGRKYLDTVNNVAHVGHEHPRVVAAGQRQMAVLNTNTRYLHRNLVGFAEELLCTLPPELNVAFLVNSGSEANELAIRLAKNYTGQQDMIVSQVGYHGNTNACIEISSYKFDGPGGKGKMPHIHVIPIPDTYRGLYRSDDPRAGSKYAGHVQEAIETMAAQHKKPAAFIFESVISCGGQVELPDQFLQEAYAHTRAAGGVCVADEVQTGCGRAGDHFWAFQQHGVVPDIVTIGKPIGNGHPLGVVVTTQALADAFKNGMEYFNTFGGNPVSCAIGKEVLRVIAEENLQQHARETGAYLKNSLRGLMNEFPIIGDVRGPGLFIGIELVKNRETKEPATAQASYFANRMRDKAILMSTDGPYNNVLKIKPPLIFSRKDADFLLEAAWLTLKEDRMRI
jgi:4-aminobutyrate aminotransferase-like enzyme/Ser/Thr protein kinase RdoA (MazF antagonist)